MKENCSVSFCADFAHIVLRIRESFSSICMFPAKSGGMFEICEYIQIRYCCWCNCCAAVSVGWMGRVGVLYYDRLVLFCLERCSAGHGACGNCVLYAQKGISADVCLRVVATGKRITYLLTWTADAIEAHFAST